LPAFVCTSCGQHYPLTDAPPAACALCDDERIAAPIAERKWVTTMAMRQTHFTTFRRLEPGLMGIGTAPHVGFGHRALLLRTTQGNVLWDCPSFLDDATVTIVTALGGIAAIATSGPTGHGAMVEWSHAFDSAPIYVHAGDRKFVSRPDSSIQFWEEPALELLPGLTMVRCGGRFDGGSVLLWTQGAGGAGVLMVGDTLHITPNRNIGFMRSYMNAVPLDADSVMRIGELMSALPYDVMYGGTWEQVIPAGAKSTVARSVRAYIDAVGLATEL